MSKILAAAVSCATLALSTSLAFATTSTDAPSRHAVHRHHVARYHAPNAPVSDVPQEAAAPEGKPDTVPEYFGHAVGSDGAMP